MTTQNETSKTECRNPRHSYSPSPLVRSLGTLCALCGELLYPPLRAVEG